MSTENKIENISGNIDVLADETRSLKAIDTAKISESINFLKKIKFLEMCYFQV